MQVRVISSAPTGGRIIKDRNVRAAVVNAIYAEGKKVKEMLDLTTDTWEHKKPRWAIGKKYFGFGAYGITVTANPATDFGAAKWQYLDGGTYFRYAMMRRGFTPKTGVSISKISHHGTSTQFLRSSSGNNPIPAFIGKKAFDDMGLQAQPGIEPRNWTKTIIEMRSGQDGPFVAAIQNAIRNALGTKVIDWGGPAKEKTGGPSYDYEGNVIKRSKEKATSFSYHGSPLMDLIMDLDE
jgi:hypothetical protein